MLDQLAINSNTYHGFSLKEAISGASEAGFTQIELSAVRDHTSHILPDMSKEELNDVKRMLDQADMKCIGISAHSNLMQKDGIQNLLNSIDLAVYFDCDYIVTATGDSHDDTDIIQDQSILLQHLQPILEKCASLNKKLVIETHGNNFSTGESIQSLITSLKDYKEIIRINYDTGNVLFYGGIEPYEDLKNTLNNVEFIHLKDKKGANHEWDFPAIGDGNFDMNRIFHILDQGKFAGPISVEIEFTPDGPKNLQEVHDSVKKSYQFIEKLLNGIPR